MPRIMKIVNSIFMCELLDIAINVVATIYSEKEKKITVRKKKKHISVIKIK